MRVKLAVCLFMGCLVLLLPSCDPGGSPDGNRAEIILSACDPQVVQGVSGATQKALAGTRAVEIFGQAVVDAFFEQIDAMLAAAREQGHQAAAHEPRLPASAIFGDPASMNFDKDGFKSEGTMVMGELDPSKYQIAFSMSVTLTGNTPQTQGKQMKYEVGLDVGTEKCPTADGKLAGESLCHYQLDMSDGQVPSHLLVDTQLNLDATINVDAEIDHFDVHLNLGAEESEQGGPQLAYGGVSNATGQRFEDLTSEEFITRLFDGLDAPGPCPAGAGVGLGLALGMLQVVAGQSRDHWRADGGCVRIQVSPEDFLVPAGATAPVEVQVVRNEDDAPVGAKIRAGTGSNGKSISPPTGVSESGSPAEFQYVAPDDGSDGEMNFEATSKAGKASLSKSVRCKFSLQITGTSTAVCSGAIISGQLVPLTIPLVLANGVYSGSGTLTEHDLAQDDDCTIATDASSDMQVQATIHDQQLVFDIQASGFAHTFGQCGDESRDVTVPLAWTPIRFTLPAEVGQSYHWVSGLAPYCEQAGGIDLTIVSND